MQLHRMHTIRARMVLRMPPLAQEQHAAREVVDPRRTVPQRQYRALPRVGVQVEGAPCGGLAPEEVQPLAGDSARGRVVDHAGDVQLERVLQRGARGDEGVQPHGNLLERE